MNPLSHRFKKLIMPLVLFLGVLLPVCAAHAAEKITFMVGSFYRSVDIKEIEYLIENKEAVGLLADVIRIAKISPDSFAKQFSRQHGLSLRKADSLTSSPFGKALLRKFGKAIFPRRSRLNGDKALSSAIVLSVADDGRYSILEIIQNYPTDIGIDLIEASKIIDQLDL